VFDNPNKGMAAIKNPKVKSNEHINWKFDDFTTPGQPVY